MGKFASNSRQIVTQAADLIFVEVVHAGFMAVQKNAKKRSCRQEKNESGQRSAKKHTAVGSVVVEKRENS